MKNFIRKCPKCNSYTLKFSCVKCQISTVDAHPARYSPDDKYARYRISERYNQERSTIQRPSNN